MIKNILITLLVLLLNNFVFSQEANEQIENSISNLKEKLILSEEQVSSITKILNALFETKSDVEVDTIKLISDTNNKIEAFLDRKQKIKFDIIKADWWKRLLENNVKE